MSIVKIILLVVYICIMCYSRKEVIYTNIGDNIRRIRKKRDMTQKQLGEKLGGVSQQQIGQWENGIKKPKIDTIRKIAEVLNCSFVELCDETLNIHVGYSSGNIPLIVDDRINPNISISEFFKIIHEDEREVPFTILTEGEKLIVYFNSLNDSGKDKVFEYMELLLTSEQYTQKEEQKKGAPNTATPSDTE